VKRDDFYHKPHQVGNIDTFLKILHRYPWLEPYWPNKDAAPWHVQARLETVHGYHITLNFWPHKLKGAIENGKPVTGYDGIREMITEAIEMCQDDHPLIESD